MGQIEQIESQIASLSAPELQAFRAWFAEFDDGKWDGQIESDISDGKLDGLADEALAQFSNGQYKRL